jgi:phosphoribosyl 1,2-cyclic phosphodiesterase
MDPTVSIQEASAITNHPTDGPGKAECCSETNVRHLVAAGVEWVKAEGVKLMATCTPAVEHDSRMILEFWGVRGGLPTPGAATVRYGGNTVCVELRCGPHLLILDAGSGLREFGRTLAAAGVPANADILLSHTHFDHICGLPFFAPMFDTRARIRFWAGHLAPPNSIVKALIHSWQAPVMPDIHTKFCAQTEFHDFAPRDALQLHPGLCVSTTSLCHPGNAIGYRISWGASSICYITDTEHPGHGIDMNLLQFVAGADIMIYDASYSDEEYQSRIGLGHSTWQAGLRLADAAAVKQLVLFHHDPTHDDGVMDAIGSAVANRRPGSLVAREGLRITVASQFDDVIARNIETDEFYTEQSGRLIRSGTSG